MAYKDKDKQRQAQRKWVRQKRVEKGSTRQGSTGPTPAEVIPNFGQSDCQCWHCRNNRANGNKLTINHGPYKPANQLGKNEFNRVPLPGDPDYTGTAEDRRRFYV